MQGNKICLWGWTLPDPSSTSGRLIRLGRWLIIAILVTLAIGPRIREYNISVANDEVLDRAYDALTRESEYIKGFIVSGDGEQKKRITVLIKDRQDFVLFTYRSGIWDFWPDNRDNRQEAIAMLRKYLEQRPAQPTGGLP